MGWWKTQKKKQANKKSTQASPSTYKIYQDKNWQLPKTNPNQPNKKSSQPFFFQPKTRVSHVGVQRGARGGRREASGQVRFGGTFDRVDPGLIGRAGLTLGGLPRWSREKQPSWVGVIPLLPHLRGVIF